MSIKDYWRELDKEEDCEKTASDLYVQILVSATLMYGRAEGLAKEWDMDYWVIVATLLHLKERGADVSK